MKVIDQLNAQIGPFFRATKIQSYYRSRTGKRSQYYIESTVSTHCTGQGSDGDTPQYAPVYKRNTPRLAFDKSSEVNVDAVKAMICEAMETATFAEAEAAAKKIQDESAKIIADRVAAYDAEKKAEAEAVTAALKPVSEDVAAARIAKVQASTSISNETKLTAYAAMVRAIVSNEYRTEFLALVSNPEVISMACDMMKVTDPLRVLAQYEFGFEARERARQLGVQGQFIGSITNALTYLVNVGVKP